MNGSMFFTGLLVGMVLGFMTAAIAIVNQIKQNKLKEDEERRLQELSAKPKSSRTMWD